VKCPSSERLAAATLGADPSALVHAERCEHCSAELAAMVEVAAFARRAPVRTASADRRARIAALVMASADVVAVEPAVRRSRVPVAMFAGAALAAAIVLVAWQLRPAPAQYALAWPVVAPRVLAPQVAPQIASTASPPPIDEVAPGVHHEPRAPIPVPPSVAATKAGAATATSRVFAGSQQHEREGQVTRDLVTLEPRPIVARARVVDPTAPTAFERGWTALREGRYADAIAEFDQVTDPAVGEDAAYWAAIASARGGNKADATRRLTAFIASYPASERIGEARALLVGLTR